jgi:hypothetical protein
MRNLQSGYNQKRLPRQTLNNRCRTDMTDKSQCTINKAITIFLSMDSFLRKVFVYSASAFVKQSIVIVTSYTKHIFKMILAAKPTLLILHKPAKFFLRQIQAAKSAALLPNTKICTQSDIDEIQEYTGKIARVIDTTLSLRENEMISRLIDGESTAAVAQEMNVSTTTVRGVRSRRKAEIIQVQSLLDKMRAHSTKKSVP